jgi:methionine-S-sulfoxide reductase|tara:strand:- start:749 stop:1192 length:444 start_codon:yes stop_codon:yes gene_type:complete
MEIAILGLGCFWGPEIKFSKVNGVIKTEVGYCGGKNKETNYEEVCTGATGHAEVVKLDFDPNIISYEKILNYFFEFHDPTTLNSQGPDFGTQYRSEIFYLNEKQKSIAEKIITDKNLKLSGKVVTKISLVKNYCSAEEYHQRYLEKR